MTAATMEGTTIFGLLESFSVKIDGIKGLQLSMQINGNAFIFNMPNISNESRVPVFAKLDGNIGKQVAVFSAPPDSLVFTFENTTIKFGKSYGGCV